MKARPSLRCSVRSKPSSRRRKSSIRTTSKFDAWLDGRAKLNDEKKGNCAACHISFRAKDGSPPQFSDFGLIAIGGPRNNDLPINKNPKFHDLGACGPERTDLKGRD